MGSAILPPPVLYFNVIFSEMKGHSRLLWDGCWSKIDLDRFYTVGRDKQIICWHFEQSVWKKSFSKIYESAITAIDSAKIDSETEVLVLGFECGKLRKLILKNMKVEADIEFDANLSHAETVNQIRFKNCDLVATCGDDNQVKIFSLQSS